MPAPAIRLIQGLREIAPDYDALIVDLWGVIHGGIEPYPGVVDALAALEARGLPVALLSNAPRRAATAIRRLTEIGVPPSAYACLITSGEATFEDLAARAAAGDSALGRAYFYIGPPWDADLVAGLDYHEAGAVEEADFLLAVGLFDEADPLESYDPLF
jgi:HAD superfamily hydrolase (TIGR01459 family)